MLNNQDDRIISTDDKITQMLGEKVMGEMLSMLLDIREIKERVRKLEEWKAEMSESRKHEVSQTLGKATIWTAIIVGSVQIVLMLIQMFLK